MRTNAKKIATWQAGNPDTRITKAALLEVLSLADLRHADLGGANLRGANLWGADLREANLLYANLWGGMAVTAGRSGDGCLVPTPDGWRITIGCWRDHTLDDLRDLIEDRVEWPEAKGDEREFRRPRLRAVLALCEAHIAEHPDLIGSLAERWAVTR